MKVVNLAHLQLCSVPSLLVEVALQRQIIKNFIMDIFATTCRFQSLKYNSYTSSIHDVLLNVSRRRGSLDKLTTCRYFKNPSILPYYGLDRMPPATPSKIRSLMYLLYDIHLKLCSILLTNFGIRQFYYSIC
jgi:hypothetical protein